MTTKTLTWSNTDKRTYRAASIIGEFEMTQFYNADTSWVVLFVNDEKYGSYLSFDEASDEANAQERAAIRDRDEQT